jgi:hypothetical protein
VIRLLVVDAIRRRPTVGVAREVVHVDVFAGEPPRAAVVFEFADQLVLLRVDADHRIAVAAEQRLDPLNEPILDFPMKCGRSIKSVCFTQRSESEFPSKASSA